MAENCYSNNNSMISIIIPVYNIDTIKLKRCINSILSQTINCYEVIIIDDGSDQIIADFLESLQNQESKFIVIHQTNQGVSAARNKGLDICQGEYVTFIDGDDWIDTLFLEQSLAIAKSTNADIVIGGLRIWKKSINKEFKILSDVPLIYTEKQRDIVQKYMLETQENKSHPELKGLRCSGPWNKLIRKNCIGTIRFNISTPIYEDLLFNLDVLQKAKVITVVNKVWYNYAIYETSAMRKYRPNGIQEQMNVIGYLKELSQKNPSLKCAIARQTITCLKKINECTLSHPKSTIKNKRSMWKKILNTPDVVELIAEFDVYQYPTMLLKDKIIAFIYKKRLLTLLLTINKMKNI